MNKKRDDMGYKIFILCLRQLWNNIHVAFRLSWFWILVYAILFIAYLSTDILTTSIDPLEPSIVTVLLTTSSFVVGIAVALVSLSTIAIGWHRFVLREEMPNSIYVLRREWPIGMYIRNSIKITLAILILLIPPYFIISSTLGSSVFTSDAAFVPNFSKLFLTATIVQFAISIFVNWLFLRMGVVLPALSVGKTMSVNASFLLTKPISGQLLITAFWVALLELTPVFIQLPLSLIIDQKSMLSIGATAVVTTVFAFISIFVGIGILTVVYGHLAENKPI